MTPENPISRSSSIAPPGNSAPLEAPQSRKPSVNRPPVSPGAAGPTPKNQPYNWPPGMQRNLIWAGIGRFRPRDPIKLFEFLTRTYGDIVHYKIGSRHVVLINHPDYIREVLVNQNDNFVKERTVRRMKMLVGEGLITSEGAIHRRQRQLSQPAFHRQRIVAYAADMVAMAEAFPEKKKWRPGATLDISVEMMELTLGIVAKTLFGADLGDEVREIGGAVSTIMGLYHFLIMMPWAEGLEPYPVPGLMKFKRARARLDHTVYRLISEHRRQNQDGGDLLSMLLRARDDREGEDHSGMTDQQLRDEIMTIFLAGYETVANAFTWTWYLLSQNPAAEAELHRELDTVLGGRPPRLEDIPQLRYTEMIMAESMRLYPPAWAQGRVALRDFDLGEYHLPAATNVFMSQFLMHRDPRYFADPLRFDPRRWTPEAKAARPKYSYFPFGAGARQCIGESFAWMEAILVLATLAQRWRMTLEPGHRVEVYPLITLRSKYGMRMKLEPRAQEAR